MSKFAFYTNWATSTLFGLLHQRKYCQEWDETLNTLLDLHSTKAKLSKCGSYLTLGEATVWVGNKYYSFGYLWWYVHRVKEARPKLSTMYRLAVLVENLQDYPSKYQDYLEGLVK